MSHNLHENNDDDGWVGLWDRHSEKSVWRRVCKSMRFAMDEIPETIRVRDEKYLSRKAKPGDTLQDARVRFWDTYWGHPTSRVSVGQAFAGVQSSYYSMLKNPYKLMWFLTPPADVLSSQRAMLDRAMRIIRSTLREDNLYTVKKVVKKNKDGSEVVTETKELNTKALSEFRNLLGDMTDRVHGGAVQRVAHAHQVVDPLAKLTSVDAVLEAANEKPEKKWLPGAEKPEKFRNDLYEDGPSVKDAIQVDIEDLMGDE